MHVIRDSESCSVSLQPVLQSQIATGVAMLSAGLGPPQWMCVLEPPLLSHSVVVSMLDMKSGDQGWIPSG